jgi:hypothetical protein
VVFYAQLQPLLANKRHKKEVAGLVSGVKGECLGNDYSYNEEPRWSVREHTKPKEARKEPQITLIPTSAPNKLRAENDAQSIGAARDDNFSVAFQS